MLQACLNGGWPRTAHPRVPITPIELASDAVAVREAGADELHIHIRSISGIETLEPTAVANALIAIRAAVPGMPIGIGTGAWISPGGRLRHSHIETWTVCPDYASVNLNEDDAPEVIKLLVRHKVGIEAGLWNRHDAARFASEIQFESCLRVLVEMTSSDVSTPERMGASGPEQKGAGEGLWPEKQKGPLEGAFLFLVFLFEAGWMAHEPLAYAGVISPVSGSTTSSATSSWLTALTALRRLPRACLRR